jgi:hypothetical protein
MPSSKVTTTILMFGALPLAIFCLYRLRKRKAALLSPERHKITPTTLLGAALTGRRWHGECSVMPSQI